MPPPPPASSLGRKRQRAGNVAAKYSQTNAEPLGDDDANYIAYPSDSEEETVGAIHPPVYGDDDGDDQNNDDGAETPRNQRSHSDGDYEMEESEADFSEDQEPQRKRAKAGDDEEPSSEDDDGDINDSSLKANLKGKRRVSQNWRNDVYRPSPGVDSDDSDLNLTELTPEKKRGKRKSVGKTGGSNSRRLIGGANVLVRNKSKSTPNLRPENRDTNRIRKSRFYEGSMNDRLTRKGGVPPFVNFEPSEDDPTGMGEYNSFGVRQSSSSKAMPPPPRPLPKGNSNLPQSTPPPPKTKFTFFAPISNWFSKRWQKATQEYEERERQKKQEVEVQKQVRSILERKAKAERLYAENKLKGINQPTFVNQRVEQEPLVTDDRVLQYVEPPLEIGVAYTTDDVYAAPKMNESTMSVATIKPPSSIMQAPTPRTSTDTTESAGSGGNLSRSSVPGVAGFHYYRDTDHRDGTPLTTDTTEPDVEGLRSLSRSPAPTPIKPLTKAEQKKKERIEKKMEELKRKLAEAELDLSHVTGLEPACTSTPAPAPSKPATKKAASAEETILIHEDAGNEEVEVEAEVDEAEKIVESVMGEPEPSAAVAARNRSMSPIKKIFPFASKKAKDASSITLHNVNESAKIKKGSPASTRGRGGGRGGRGGKAASRPAKRNTSEDPN
ncbi:hypothetical protein ABW20_dc0109602 [Dactylellina cionopaga]|nr:hypothetical protein ABW20_dc0109602 [Dactylellina cionopaga]